MLLAWLIPPLRMVESLLSFVYANSERGSFFINKAVPILTKLVTFFLLIILLTVSTGHARVWILDGPLLVCECQESLLVGTVAHDDDDGKLYFETTHIPFPDNAKLVACYPAVSPCLTTHTHTHIKCLLLKSCLHTGNRPAIGDQ